MGDVRRGCDRRGARAGAPRTANGSPRAGSRCSPAASPKPRQTASPKQAQTARSRRWRPTCLRWSRRLDYETLTLAQLRARLSIAARRRPGGAAGLRGVHQVARAVPDSAGQQDHPRELPSDRVRARPVPGKSVAGSRGRDQGREVDRPARHGLGRGSARPDQGSAGFQNGVHGAARSCRRHVAVDHLSSGTGAQRAGAGFPRAPR